MGGAETARQYLRADAVDEVRLHLVPGGGTRLFDDGPWPSIDLRPIAVTSAQHVTHLTYEADHSAAQSR